MSLNQSNNFATPQKPKSTLYKRFFRQIATLPSQHSAILKKWIKKEPLNNDEQQELSKMEKMYGVAALIIAFGVIIVLKKWKPFDSTSSEKKHPPQKIKPTSLQKKVHFTQDDAQVRYFERTPCEAKNMFDRESVKYRSF